MTYAEFQQSLKPDRFAPIYLFHGEEDFLIEEGVQLIMEKALDEGTKGFNLDVVYGSKVDAKDVVSHASSFPMTGPRRVVIVKEFEKLVNTEIAKEIVAAYINKPLESTVLVLVSLNPDFRRKPFTDLKKRAELVECKPLYDNQVPAWIGDRIRKQGGKRARKLVGLSKHTSVTRSGRSRTRSTSSSFSSGTARRSRWKTLLPLSVPRRGTRYLSCKMR